MPIRYLLPLKLAWERTKGLLFRPFRIEVWIVLGFAAWLAGLIDPSSGMQEVSKNGLDFSKETSLSALEGLIAVSVILGVSILAILIGVVLLWVSSRGKFVFLHNVLKENTEIKAPWAQYGRIGDSLFLWRLAFYAVAALVALGFVLTLILVARGGSVGTDLIEALAGASMLMLVAGFILLMIPFYCVTLALNDFVVPLMLKHNATATQAWGIFLPLLRERLPHFVVYLLFLAAARVVLAVALGAVTLATCCIGGIILSIPFVGTVLLLPVHATYRGYSVEFLAQFGPPFALEGTSAES